MQIKRIFASILLLLCLFLALNACITPDPSVDPDLSVSLPADEITAPSGGASFAVHFIDVGQADAALIICDGKTMLIDGGNADDSNLIYSYLKKQNISHLDYVICTHAHEDHVGGLSGALTAATAGKVYAPVTDYDSRAFRNFATKASEHGGGILIPSAGEQWSLGSATVTVLGPIQSYEETNDTSIVLRVVFGKTSFLFTGDMETAAEADLLDANLVLQSTVLKIGHHGSTTSSSYRFLRAVAPKYGVISVGTDNSYGHPHDEILSRLRDAEVTLYRTDLQGDIVCTSDGEVVSFTTSKTSQMPTNPTEGEESGSADAGVEEYAYIGNLNTKKFHLPTCSSLPDEQNRIWFTTREEAVEKNYFACGICKP